MLVSILKNIKFKSNWTKMGATRNWEKMQNMLDISKEKKSIENNRLQRIQKDVGGSESLKKFLFRK